RDASLEILLELKIGSCRHFLTPEKQEMQPIVPRNHRTHLGYAGLLELARNGVEQRAADAVQTRVRVDGHGKDPAARCRAKFPCANLADDESEDAPFSLSGDRLGDKEEAFGEAAFAVAREDVAPVVVLANSRNLLIQRYNLRDIGS